MKVGLIEIGSDSKTLKGLGRYAKEVINYLEKEGIEVKVFSTSEPRRIKVWTNLPKQLIKDKSDVYHCLNPDVAITPVLMKDRVVVTFHDLIPLFIQRTAYTFHAKYLSKLYVNIIWKTVAKKCEKIIAISSQTKDELISTFNIPEDKIVVVHNGVSEKFRPLNLEKKYILFVGNFSFRKRVDLAIEIYKEFCKMIDNPPKLVIIGGYLKTKHQQQFNIQGLIKDIKENVIILNKVSDEELIKYYNQSYALLFTSEYEGFGLPVIEASRCKCVPIIREEAKIPREVKENAIVEKIENIPLILYDIVTDEKKRKHYENLFYEKSLRFSWKKHIKELIKIYEEVLQY